MAPRVLRALCGVLLGASATTQPGCDDASVVSCGEGVFHQIDGHAYCVYGTEATTPGSDFVCPARTPNKLEVAGGVVCRRPERRRVGGHPEIRVLRDRHRAGVRRAE